MIRSGTWVNNRAAQVFEQRGHQGRGTGAVHVVVTEYADRLAARCGAGETVGGAVHVQQGRRVGEQGAQGGLQEVGGRVDGDAAGRQQAADHFGHAMRWAMARPVGSSLPRQTQRRPDRLRVTPSAAGTGGMAFMAKSGAPASEARGVGG